MAAIGDMAANHESLDERTRFSETLQTLKKNKPKSEITYLITKDKIEISQDQWRDVGNMTLSHRDGNTYWFKVTRPGNSDDNFKLVGMSISDEILKMTNRFGNSYNPICLVRLRVNKDGPSISDQQNGKKGE